MSRKPDVDELRRQLDGLEVIKPKSNGPAKPAIDLSGIPLTPAAWSKRTLDPPDYLMGELYSTTSRVLIAADTGLGKSMFGLALAFTMNLGLDFMHWRAHRPARALVIDGEMPRDLLQERIELPCKWFGIEPLADGPFILSREDMEDMPPLDSEEGQAWVLGTIEALGGIDFVIFDNVSALTVGDLREETTWKPLVPLARELSKRKAGQLWLHHVGHDKNRVYGSRTFSWQMDAVGLGTAVERADADVSMKIEWQKARRRTPGNRADFEPVHVVLQDDAWSGTAVETSALSRNGGTRTNAAGQRVLQALDTALAAAGERPPSHDVTRGVNAAVKLTTLRRYFEQMAGYGNDAKDKDAERKAWDRGRENAQAATMMRIWGDWVWRP